MIEARKSAVVRAGVVGWRGLSAQRRREAIWGVVLASPAILGFILWQLGPMIASLLIGFTNWNVISTPSWIGLDNFEHIFVADPLFVQALKVTIGFSLFSVPGRIILAFALAMLLNQQVRGLPIFRTIFYIPSIVPLIAASVLWTWLFSPDFGLANALLRLVGLSNVHWLNNSGSVLPSLILMSFWDVGGFMIIFLAGLQGVPRHLYEAVVVDGGNAWHRLRHVTLPMMTPTIFFNLILAIIGSLQTFTQAFVMTNGGPNNASLFYVLYIYRKAFSELEMGYAAALAWMLFLLIAALSALVFRSSSLWVYYEGDDR